MVIGDTEQLTGDALPENQIVENTGERAAFMVRAAAEAGCQRIALVAGGDPKRSWGKELRLGAETKAAELGVEVRYVRHLARKRDKTTHAILQGTPADAVLIDGFRSIGSFVEKLDAAGLQSGRNIRIFANGEMHPGTIFVKSDYRAFSQAILKWVGSLIKNPASSFGRVVLSGLIRHSLISLE